MRAPRVLKLWSRTACTPIVLAVLLAGSALADTPVERVRRRGPDLLSRYHAAVKLLGAIEVTGALSGADGVPVRLEGRFGAGRLSVALAADSATSAWSTFVRLDGDEVEVEDRRLNWVLRRELREVNIPVTEEGDLFGLMLPEDGPTFLGENAEGQTWEYPVKGGIVYRVWLTDHPLRMTRRDVIRPGAPPLTFLYREFTGAARSPIVLPRSIRAEAEGAVLFDLVAERLALRPGVPRLRPLDDARRALYRTGEALFADSRYLAASRRIANLADPDPPEGPLSVPSRRARVAAARRDSPAILGLLDELELARGRHPLLELQRAQIARKADDLLLAGISIRGAQELGRVILPLAARLGVLELDATGDSALLDWAVRAVRPSEPGDLTEAEQSVHVEVIGAAAAAWRSRGETTAASELLRQSWLYDPTNRALASLLAADHLEAGDETAAVRVARSLVTARPDDLRALFLLGDLQEAIGMLDDAEALYRAARDTWSREAAPWLRLGRLLLARRQFPEAEDVFDELIERFETWDDAATRRADIANEIAWELVEANMALPKARRMADYALSVTPDDPYYLDTLGLIHWRLGRRTSAIMIFERALARLDHPLIREHLAQARR